jgi:hypothetical protein
MKIRVLIASTVICAMSWPVFATLVSPDSRSTHILGPALSSVSDQLKATHAGDVALNSIPQSPLKVQTYVESNPYEPSFGPDFGATTELKIDLDSFDMEYVLRVQ